MPIKVIFYYNQYRQGFSETYYHSSGDPVAFVKALPATFLNSMTSFRSPTTQLWAIRGSLTTTPRKSYLRIIRGKYAGAVLGAAADLPDVVSTDAVCRLSSQGGATRRVFLRGLRDEWVTRDAFGNDQLNAPMQQALNNYITQIKEQGFSIRKSQVPPDGGLIWWQATLLAPHAGNALWTDITIPVNPGVVVNQQVRFVGINKRDLPYWPRVATVVSQEGGPPWKMTIPYRLNWTTYGPINMRVTLATPALEAIETLEFERYSERRSGRPFGSLRGRSRGVSTLRG